MLGFIDGGYIIINIVVIMMLANLFHVGRDDWFFTMLAYIMAMGVMLSIEQAMDRGYLQSLRENSSLYFVTAVVISIPAYMIVLDAKLISGIFIAVISAIFQALVITLMLKADGGFMVLDDWIIFYKILAPAAPAG